MHLLKKCAFVFLESLFINLVLIAGGVVFTLLGYPAAGVPFWALLLFVLYFFRDPERRPPETGGVILSTADGKVMRVTRGTHPDFDGEVWRILIFMSPLDVHRNRAPISGTVTRVEHIPGRFLPAYGDSIETQNERNLVVFEGGVKVHVVQIAGILARRIVCRTEPGRRIEAGEQFGLIRFGSANEVIFPAEYEPAVEPGSVVRAGTDVLAEMN